MKEFSEYLKKEDLLEKLVVYYNIGLNELDTKKALNNIIKELDVPRENSEVQNSRFDFLGAIYEDFLNREERKSLGQYYTPENVVNYILKAVGYGSTNKIEHKRLVDLSCGVGNFIVSAVRVLILRYLKIYKRKEIKELDFSQAIVIIETIKSKIHGIDINPIACILCQINIHYVLFEIFKLIKDKDKEYHLPLFNIKNFDAMTIIKSEQFDFVVGNPPYLFIRDIPKEHRQIIKKMDFKTGQGQYDYFQIFIELGIKILKNKGLLGYIVPDSLLVLSNRSILRKYIVDNTKIKEIYHTGSKFEDPVVSNIIIILEKESNIVEREENRIKINIVNQQQKSILQTYLIKWNYKFLINVNNDNFPIITNLNEKFPKLRDLMIKEGFKFILSRGVELTKSGEVIFCRNCEKFLPIPKKELVCPDCQTNLKIENIEKIVRDSIPQNKHNRFELFVDSIKRYHINRYKYIEVNKSGINYKNSEIYDDRIIIRQLSQNNLICATYDKNLSLTSQSLYNLKICQSNVREFNDIYLLGLINSLLLSYYFIQMFGSYKKLFPRILIEKIKDLPIKVPENEEEKEMALEIIEKVKILLECVEKEDSKFNQIQKDIDDLIFKLYKVTDSQKQHILDYMSS
ncbi:MAG: HsdM family class I SAM-dependent methyltransferase [Promethearchaeota archaeon]|jgi:tRNA1(Val) A37 N6-methylase TrmN6